MDIYEPSKGKISYKNGSNFEKCNISCVLEQEIFIKLFTMLEAML